MFERRLKIVLALLCVMTACLVGRAVQVQVVEHADWAAAAVRDVRANRLIETSRGSLLDFQGRPLAVGGACRDACVQYQVIPTTPDDKWVHDYAKQRLLGRRGEEFKAAKLAARRTMLEAEIAAVRLDIERMWVALAMVSGKSVDDVDAIRTDIVMRVDRRRRALWNHNYRHATSQKAEPAGQSENWFTRWILKGGSSRSEQAIEEVAEDAPGIDQYAVRVAEEDEPQVILSNIDPDTYQKLWKDLDNFPGLVLRPGSTREYPFKSSACHVIGYLSRVQRGDIDKDGNADDPAREYLPNDYTGRAGLERLCEPLLRGSRGIVTNETRSGVVEESTKEAVPGKDVRTSIDIELQDEIAASFQNLPFGHERGSGACLGAAVVLDVPTGQVRAMVSVPGYDLNGFEDHFKDLAEDVYARPLKNRALQFALEPGSTIKPVVGLGAITSGVMGLDETIECTGVVKINGVEMLRGHCWTLSPLMRLNFGLQGAFHHCTPSGDPHGNGFLTFADALERSCNVYFENMAYRMHEEGLHDWMDRFGLGRVSGVGIAESPGHIPSADPSAARSMSDLLFAGIGEGGQIAATPMQMANVAATIARDGVWVRPTLLADSADARRLKSGDGPDRVDLHLLPAAVERAKLGMYKVVHSEAGTGNQLKVPEVDVCGKTGSAQTSKFSVVRKRADGTKEIEVIQPGHPGADNPLAPWYRAFGAKNDEISHAWYIGFAPREHPQVAFAVMVEYGGSGGIAAAAVAKQALESCIQHGYLTPTHATPVATAELIHDVGR